MKKFLGLVLLGGLCAQGVWAANAAFIGSWCAYRSIDAQTGERTADQTVFEFRADGTYTQQYVGFKDQAIEHGRWRLEGQRIMVLGALPGVPAAELAQPSATELELKYPAVISKLRRGHCN